MNDKILEEYSFWVYDIYPFFMSITKKKKLTKIDANTYYSELMFILLNLFQLQKLMNQTMKADNLFLRIDKRHQKKNLVANLSELIQVMQEEVMIQL